MSDPDVYHDYEDGYDAGYYDGKMIAFYTMKDIINDTLTESDRGDLAIMNFVKRLENEIESNARP